MLESRPWVKTIPGAGLEFPPATGIAGTRGLEISTHFPHEVDENQHPGETPAIYVLRLAESKARACAGPICLPTENRIVLAADTTVVDGNTILGKPEDASEAKEMLRQLRGHTHQVYTGIAVMRHV